MRRGLAFALALLAPAATRAAEIAEQHGARGVPWSKLAFSTINLLIFLFLVRRFVQRLDLAQWLASRRQRIAEALEQADRAKREAEALRAEWQRRLESLGAELEALLAQARQDIAAERDQILAAARHTAEAIRRDALRAAENELRSARDALRAELAQQALAIAERLAPQRLSPADQRRFVAEFVQRVDH
jgi:F-type H+-transporting ATPase subunit b